MEGEKQYIAIDLKSFYASVECVERGLDPLSTNLVVADAGRTSKTICLAVTPSLKAYGIPGRARLFEVEQKIEAVNAARLQKAPGHTFSGKSCFAQELENNPALALDYIVAPPRMAHYMSASSRIYEIYMKYVSPEDIHVYSIDEVFIDATSYLRLRGMSARDFARAMIQDILDTTGITATAGIGTNMYLCKVALDIAAKHAEPDIFGVRIAALDEQSYRRLLWDHRPLTDFWRVGRGYAKKLEAHGLFTMGDIARCSLGEAEDFYNPELLYRLFGINAELLIDHAWGFESCTISDIKAYRPAVNSISSGQVLQCPYDFEKARIIVHEMADMLSLELVDKRLVTDRIVLTLGYDVENLSDPLRRRAYSGQVSIDAYGREVPKHAHGTEALPRKSSSTRLIVQAALSLFDRIADRELLIRRLNIVAENVVDESLASKDDFEQLDFFTDYSELEREEEALRRERRRQQAMLSIRKKHGKNAILKGTNFEEGATARDRNRQIGGHKA